MAMESVKVTNPAAVSDEKIEITTNDGEKSKTDILQPVIEQPIIKDTVLTIDTTDKRRYGVPARQPVSYAAKKTVAQGMMDVALITANANQLRYLIEFQRHSPTFFVSVFLIVVSLLLQIAVGVSLIFKGRFDMKGESKFAHARRINNYVVSGVFMITIINVFIASFNISTPPAIMTFQPPPPPQITARPTFTPPIGLL
ncbi:ninjurin-1 isoform X2 [Cephus cinctus]|nr:ninjurin-1 isoform X2 [Cephus cinctus]